MPRRRTVLMQPEPPYIPEPEGIAGMEALYRNGIDAGYEHRAMVRQLNAARQEADRREHEAREPPLFNEAWLADQLRKSQLSGMRLTHQAHINECRALRREREGV